MHVSKNQCMMVSVDFIDFNEPSIAGYEMKMWC